MKTFDAIIIGAGPAGSTTALCLARAGWSVALVEKTPFPRRKVCGEFISAPTWRLLERLGVARDIAASAGPEVREVGVYGRECVATAAMPAADAPWRYGRAIERERLDALLLDAARTAGAAVWQPWRVRGWQRTGERYRCELQCDAASVEVEAPILIAAHGSWDTARLPIRRPPSDLLAFKAHFSATALPRSRMPLLAFAGGYGGLVHTAEGRTSFSCCVRRRTLATCRLENPGLSAGAAVLAHASGACRGLREALSGAVRDGEWLAAGRLRIGMRSVCGDGYFAVGNALGEAHPIVAEGISMAIQSAWLLASALIAASPAAATPLLNSIAGQYERAFRECFRTRMRAASAYAALATRPAIADTAAWLLAHAPGLFDAGARWAGKTRDLRPIT